MKSTFLAVSSSVVGTVPKVVFRDVNNGDGLNEFRSGSQKGDIVLDFYGDQSLPTPGKTYLFTLAEFDQSSITTEKSDTVSDSAIAAITAPTPQPLSVAFNALVTVGVDGTGAPTLSIDATPVAAPAAETEDTANTQATALSAADEAGGLEDSAGAENVGNANVGTAIDTSGVSNTQDNAGPAAGAENNEAGANLVNNADTQSNGVGGAAQVS